jgi:SynChlorMet cassette radical SAM/SPASM protein ScmE
MGSTQILSAPSSMGIAITGRCNLRCKYCFYADEMVALGDLSTEKWLDFFRQLGALGVMRVTLTGGEAFTRPDLFDLIDGIVSNRMRYNILSNGTLITEKTLEQFAVGKRLQRLDHIQISIDGSQAEIHDKSRPKSFERAVRGLRLLHEAGIPVGVRVTINRYNLYDLENIAHLLLDEIGLDSFGTNDAMPVGSGCVYESEITLNAAEQGIAMQTMARLMERYPGRLKAQAGPQAKLKFYAQMEHAKETNEKAHDWEMGYLTACGCVFSSVDILHDGTIVPCHMLYQLALGNIQTDSIETIWHSHPVLQALRDRRSIAMDQVVGCQGCEWTSYCNGSCPGMAYQLTNDFNRANSKDCYRRFLAETGELRDIHC